MPTNSDEESIVNPPPIMDIITDIESTAEAFLRTSSVSITNTYHRRPQASSMAPPFETQTVEKGTTLAMPMPLEPLLDGHGHKHQTPTVSPQRPSPKRCMDASTNGPTATSKGNNS